MCTSHEEPDFAAAAKRNGVVGILPKSTAPEKLPDILALLREAIAAALPAAVSAPLSAPRSAGEPRRPAPAHPAGAAPAASEPPGLTEARVLDLIDSRLDGLLDSAMGERIDERIAARISKLLAPMLDDLRRDLTERLGLETRRTLEEGLADSRDLIEARAAETRRAVDSQLAEARQAQSATKRTEEAAGLEAGISRMVNETLPHLVKIEIEAERGQIMDLVEQYLREFGPKPVAQAQASVPSDEHQAALEGALVAKASDIARRESREIAESSIDQVNQIADAMVARAKSGLSRVYLAIAGAAILGVAAAAAVYAILA
jgi:hypothetical protein